MIGNLRYYGVHECMHISYYAIVVFGDKIENTAYSVHIKFWGKVLIKISDLSSVGLVWDCARVRCTSVKLSFVHESKCHSKWLIFIRMAGVM